MRRIETAASRRRSPGAQSSRPRVARHAPGRPWFVRPESHLQYRWASRLTCVANPITNKSETHSHCTGNPGWQLWLSAKSEEGKATGLILQQLSRDYEPLNLAGALADRAQLHVAIKLLSGIILDKAVTAVNLHSFVRAPDSHFTGEELRHGRYLRGLHARVFHRRCAHGQEHGRVDLGGHVGQLPLDRLEIADRLAKLLALLRILQGRLVRALRHAQRQRGDRNAAAVKHTHGVGEPLPFSA